MTVEGIESRILLSHSSLRARAEAPPTPPPIIALVADPAIPLPDLTGTYQGQDGGLYGGGSNVPPPAHAELADAAIARIQPLDASGRPSARGRIGMLSIGQSTTRMIFAPFQQMARALPNRNPRLTLINGAQDGMVLQNWAQPGGPWGAAAGKVRQSGLTNRQVQVVWIESTEILAWRYGDLSSRLSQTADDIGIVMRKIKSQYPNVRAVFLTSRPYGGYGPAGVDPEPYAYEGGFGVRLAIQRQIAGDPSINADPARGKVVAPVMLWGPYDWANGTAASSTGLTWQPWDFTDGVHPSGTGSVKAASLLMQFFRTDPRAEPWFLG